MVIVRKDTYRKMTMDEKTVAHVARGGKVIVSGPLLQVGAILPVGMFSGIGCPIRVLRVATEEEYHREHMECFGFADAKRHNNFYEVEAVD